MCKNFLPPKKLQFWLILTTSRALPPPPPLLKPKVLPPLEPKSMPPPAGPISTPPPAANYRAQVCVGRKLNTWLSSRRFGVHIPVPPHQSFEPIPLPTTRLPGANMFQGFLKGMVYAKAEHTGWEKKSLYTQFPPFLSYQGMQFYGKLHTLVLRVFSGHHLRVRRSAGGLAAPGRADGHQQARLRAGGGRGGQRRVLETLSEKKSTK